MRKQHLWVFGAVALIVAVVAVLAMRRRYDRRVVFPDGRVIARLPIRAPLVRPDLSVMATVRNGKRDTPLWMTVDSGATGVSMPSSSFHGLGLDLLRGVSIRSEDPRGRVFVHDAGLLPEVGLGELVVSDVVTAVGAPANVIGQSVLSHDTWEIDWDSGLLTLGGDPWPAGGDVTVIPLRRVGDADVVTVTIHGAPVEMVLDTGALASIVPEEIGLRAGIPVRRIPPTTMRSLGGDTIVRRLFSGEVSLAGRGLGRMQLASVQTGGRRAAYGLLGLDVLSRFSLQVVPGSRLALRSRRDVRATAKERIARWSFLPQTCAHAGCVHADIVAKEPHAELAVTLEADLAQGIEVLLGCADDHADHEDGAVPTGSSFAFAEPPDVLHHVRVRLGSAPRGTVTKTTLEHGAGWFNGGGAACASLEPLDVSPIAPPAKEATKDAPSADRIELEASFWP